MRAGWERVAVDPDGKRKQEAKIGDAFKLLFEATNARATSKKPTRSEDTLDFQKKQSKSWLLFCGIKLAKEKTKLGEMSLERRTELRTLGESWPLVSVGPRFVDEFINWRRNDPNVGEGTIGKDLSVCRPAMRLALRAGLWGGSLEATFPKHEIQYEPGKRWATREELPKLLAELEPNRRAVVAYAVATGAEPRAIERALREDVASEKATLVRVRGTKNSKRDRWVPILFPWQKELLAVARAGADGGEGKLFGKWNNCRRVMGEACGRVDVEPLSRTDLRRTFAHWMKDEGVRQEDLMVAMGHSSRKMLDQVYGRATTGAELYKRMEEAAAERRVAVLTLVKGGKDDKAAQTG